MCYTLGSCNFSKQIFPLLQQCYLYIVTLMYFLCSFWRLEVGTIEFYKLNIIRARTLIFCVCVVTCIEGICLTGLGHNVITVLSGDDCQTASILNLYQKSGIVVTMQTASTSMLLMLIRHQAFSDLV